MRTQYYTAASLDGFIATLDDLFVQVGSVTLGSGKPLLPRAITDPPLRLVSVRQVGTGFAEMHYQFPGPG